MHSLNNPSNLIGSSNTSNTLSDRVINKNTQNYSSDALIWKAQFDGILNLLQKDENIVILQGGGTVTVHNKICPYDSTLEESFIVFCNIFYTKFQLWAISRGLSYTQSVIDKGIIVMNFAEIVE